MYIYIGSPLKPILTGIFMVKLERTLIPSLKETRNSYFCVTPKIRHFTSVHYFSSNNPKSTN